MDRRPATKASASVPIEVPRQIALASKAARESGFVSPRRATRFLTALEGNQRALHARAEAATNARWAPTESLRCRMASRAGRIAWS